MMAAEFRTALAALDYTQRGFAVYVGANERTVRRWADGEQDIHAWVPVMLDLMERQARVSEMRCTAEPRLVAHCRKVKAERD
jgi:DNA-binding transcriptional regulator YiaG